MQYEFKKYKWEKLPVFGITTDADSRVLENMGSHDWTPAAAQKIIDGVQNTIDNNEEFEWANEDVHLLSDSTGVTFWNMQDMLGHTNQDLEAALVITHQQFITFMNNFKTFIADNSK